MCGINVIKKINKDISYINFHCQKRGPNQTNIQEINGITFIHNLLHITGTLTPQPFVTDNVVCIYNGEIYNYQDFGKEYQSDGYCLLDLYQKYGIDFTKHLDGEFAIAIIDFNQETILISTDVFSTKPIFYCLENDNFMISSYSSCIQRNNMKNIIKLEANKTILFNLNTLQKIKETYVYKFDLNQHKQNYNDWVKAFDNAIKKRIADSQKKVFVSLSSGYDSGAICCALNQQKFNYKTYTILGSEDAKVLQDRFKINIAPHLIYKMNQDTIQKYKKKNMENCCDYQSKVRLNMNTIYSVLKDNASNGGSFIYQQARNDNYVIGLSGQGADEIFSDYGFNGVKIKSHSCFGGKFPNNLSSIFPWESFYGGIGQCLIMKEEIIGGSYGIELRYPFLDKFVVQEFLWLHPKLKNKYYKAPLHHYLTINNYPFKKNQKIGFNNLL